MNKGFLWMPRVELLNDASIKSGALHAKDDGIYVIAKGGMSILVR